MRPSSPRPLALRSSSPRPVSLRSLSPGPVSLRSSSPRPVSLRLALLLPVIAGVLLAGALLAGAVPARACTAFCLNHGDELVVGKNYDWNVDAGLVLVNKRGVSKLFNLGEGAAGPRWISRFGSVTFNQYGRDLPQGGINEHGLVIEVLWLNGTEFPPADHRPELGTTQWIQYQLDTAADVTEVVASLKHIRIRSQVEVHFFVTDRQGRSASIEFLDGEFVCHRGETMPAATLTNHSYDASANYLRRHEGWGGDAGIPHSRSSLDRFVRASAGSRNYDPARHGDPVDHVFGLLAEVAQGEATKWSIAYDLKRLRVHFRTHREGAVKTVDLAALDFDCDTPVLMADINHAAPGPLPFEEYTRAANLALVTHSYRRTGFLADAPTETLERVAGYPDFSSCAQ